MDDQLTSCTAAMLGMRSRSFCVTATRTVMTCTRNKHKSIKHQADEEAFRDDWDTPVTLAAAQHAAAGEGHSHWEGTVTWRCNQTRVA